MIPKCPHENGHAWVIGRPVFESENCDKTLENVKYNTRQCRRCGYHDKRDPQLVDSGKPL